MSLTVEKLNDDTTFLLAFAPTFAPKTRQKAGRKFPGAFTILIDPWLVGHSSILHPTFQSSHHTSSCAINSLADLDDLPDLIIISQDKPDHCHKATLSSLPPDARTRILATPAAAKKIKSWKHFHEDIVHVMKPYDPLKPALLTDIRLPPYTSSSSPGKVTIANIPTKIDMTGLHNAIAITYRPPGSLLAAFDGQPVNLSDMMRPDTGNQLRSTAAAPLTEAPTLASPPAPPSSPRAPSTVSSNRSTSAPRMLYLDALGPTASMHGMNSKASISVPSSPLPGIAPSPPLERTDSKVSIRSTRHLKEKTLSVLYTPHGLSFNTLRPYITNHLMRIKALPLTALFHSIHVETNPWFMGGTVVNGAPGGVELAARLSAKNWISAHDERKDNKGMVTTWIKSKRYSEQEVLRMLEDRVQDGREVARVWMPPVGARLSVES